MYICPECDNDKFYVILFMRNWVKINTNGEVICEDGEVEESYLEDDELQCTECEKFFSKSELSNN